MSDTDCQNAVVGIPVQAAGEQGGPLGAQIVRAPPPAAPAQSAVLSRTRPPGAGLSGSYCWGLARFCRMEKEERDWLLISLGWCCTTWLPILIVGICYHVQFEDEAEGGYPRQHHLQYALLISAIVIGSVCGGALFALSCMASSFEPSVTQVVPCCWTIIAIAVGCSLIATVENNNLPGLSVTLCQGEPPLPRAAADRVCPFWHNATPYKELSLGRCAWFNQLSCCTAAKVESLFDAETWIGRTRGDRYYDGECALALEALACWPCSPDSQAFYRGSKLRVCPRMCENVYRFCKDSTFWDSSLHGKRFGQLFETGKEMCEYLQYEVPEDGCNCYEQYWRPQHWWEHYGQLDWSAPDNARR
eukprot:TRINITY_DN11551_c0_g2_i1.p1 TRINITY_DN11551_c0_g2~~TRINITY_DN11551_c0_g2_i1.p1  ORF type:complete len:391 (+),score=102.07 TRINITY_DN11551_c0_g2_i1:95-1174(+)